MSLKRKTRKMSFGFGDMGVIGYQSEQFWSWWKDGSRKESLVG